MSWLGKLKTSGLVIQTYRLAFSMGHWLPKKKKRIMFESFNGRQYSDSPRAIYEYMKEHHPDYEMIWCADRRFTDAFKNQPIEWVTRFSFKWLLYMPRAKYWVTNSRLPYWFPKSKKTVYVQTWHGTPLKKLGLDIPDVKMAEEETESYKEGFVSEASKWDYLVSPNPYSSAIFRRAFGFQGTMLETGYPRNDVLKEATKEDILALKERLQVPTDKKIVLYAPTWRDDSYYEKGKYKFQLQLDMKKMKETLGDEYIVLLRMHYLVAEQMDMSLWEGFAYDMSHYEDIRHLYLVSDVLITDYSSVFFDFAVLQKPILFFVYDIDHYRDQLRGFYVDFEKMAPGPLLKTTEEVVDALESLQSKPFTPSDRYQALMDTYTSLEDGKATERVVQAVFK